MNAAVVQLPEREVVQQVRGMPTSDGAGVKLTRVIGQPALPDLDPFLMLDEFGTTIPAITSPDFPSIRIVALKQSPTCSTAACVIGITTATKESWCRGAVQWMTAGRGIVHSEMPEQQARPHARLPTVAEPAGRTRS